MNSTSSISNGLCRLCISSVCFVVLGWSHYLAHAGLKLMILLPQPPRYWITDMYHHTQTMYFFWSEFRWSVPFNEFI
jgi:hypothetical protein